MYYIGIIEHFSASHQLRGYHGNCENLHGHNWKVEVVVKGEKLNEIGILIDFRDLKNIVKSILKELDHTHLNNHPFFTKKNPSSENIAQFIYEKLKKELSNRNFLDISIEEVKVFESENAYSIYKE